MPGRPLRGALIGAGNVGLSGHLPGWLARTDVEIVATADPRSAGEEAMRAASPKTRWFSSAAELFDSGGIDFVDIATPPGTHFALCRQALERGLHVLCEKPLTLSSFDAKELAVLARKNDLALACVHNWNYAPQVRAVAEIAKSGSLGPLRRIWWSVRRDRPAAASGTAPNWRTDPVISGGGISVDHGWHAVYVVLSWMGRTPDRVAARFERRLDAASAVEDTAEISLDFGGALAEISLTWAAPDRRNQARLEGDSGTLELDDDRLERHSPAGETLEVRRFPECLSAGSHHADWFGGVATSFLAEIRDPSTRGASLAAAIACAEILEACGASAADSSRPRAPVCS
jgi:predicted dehydrogenase